MRVRIVVMCAGMVAAAAACASAPTPSATERVARIDDASGGVSYELSARSDAHRTELSAPSERVWDALLQTYGALGIEADYIDGRNYRYGVQRYTNPQIAGRRVENLMRCSEGAGPSAVVGRRTEVSIISTLRALPSGGTLLATEVVGIARRLDGTSTPPVRCESGGQLEQMIAAGVRERLAR